MKFLTSISFYFFKDVISALDMLTEQNQWQRCLDKAQQISTAVLQKYLALYATKLINEGDCKGALDLYLNYDAPAIEANFNIYKRIPMDCFSLREEETISTEVWRKLRDFLYKLIEVIGNYIIKFFTITNLTRTILTELL